MEFSSQPDKKRWTWVTRLLLAFGVVALVVVVVANGSTNNGHVDANEAMMAPMTEVAADATVPAHSEFYISVEKDDVQAPKASEEGELTVFEEQAPVDADEEEKQLDAWNGSFVAFFFLFVGQIPINEMASARHFFFVIGLKRAMVDKFTLHAQPTHTQTQQLKEKTSTRTCRWRETIACCVTVATLAACESARQNAESSATGDAVATVTGAIAECIDDAFARRVTTWVAAEAAWASSEPVAEWWRES